MIKCDKCNKKMIGVTEDEGGLAVHWCYECGTLATDLEGNIEFFPIGKKPHWSED